MTSVGLASPMVINNIYEKRNYVSTEQSEIPVRRTNLIWHLTAIRRFRPFDWTQSKDDLETTIGTIFRLEKQ